MANRIQIRDPIQVINTSKNAVNTLRLNTPSGYSTSMLEKELIARKKPTTSSDQTLMRGLSIQNRGLNNMVRTSQAIFAPPMMKDNTEIVKMYTRGPFGDASTPNVSNQDPEIGRKIMSNSQAVFSGRLY
jgi:hypothetical protein